MHRRHFLKSALLSTSGLILLGPSAWAARTNPDSSRRSRLIVVFMRGAVDGLNLVIPYAESAYYDARPSIAIPRTDVLDLDGHFGLHPALASLLPLWRERSLAFVHACGSPDPTRSHFDAQDYMESGTPGAKTTPDGWMNRLLAALPGPHSATQALNLGPTVPRILSGRMAVASITPGPAASKPMPIDRPGVENAFAALYAGNGPLSNAFKEGYRSRQQLLAEMEPEMQRADNGAPEPGKQFVANVTRMAHLIARDPGIQLAFMGVGGWDTHVNQGSVNGQLANHLQPLGESLMALVRGLSDSYQDTVIIVMSEFGRTAHENGNGGTDHGHGNVMWLMGGKVAGGQVGGRWPALAGANLYEGRDLAVTTDFRAVIAAVLAQHLMLSPEQSAAVLPGFTGTPAQGLLRI